MEVTDVYQVPASKPDRPRGFIDRLIAVFGDVRRLLNDHLELVSLEGQRALDAVIKIAISAVLIAVLGFTAWVAIIAGLVAWAVSAGLPIGWGFAIAALAHIVAAAALVFFIRSKLPEVTFPATLRQLRATAKGSKP